MLLSTTNSCRIYHRRISWTRRTAICRRLPDGKKPHAGRAFPPSYASSWSSGVGPLIGTMLELLSAHIAACSRYTYRACNRIKHGKLQAEDFSPAGTLLFVPKDLHSNSRFTPSPSRARETVPRYLSRRCRQFRYVATRTFGL